MGLPVTFQVEICNSKLDSIRRYDRYGRFGLGIRKIFIDTFGGSLPGRVRGHVENGVCDGFVAQLGWYWLSILEMNARSGSPKELAEASHQQYITVEVPEKLSRSYKSFSTGQLTYGIAKLTLRCALDERSLGSLVHRCDSVVNRGIGIKSDDMLI